MEPTPKPHVSHAIAWSLIALFAGSLAFGIWMYSNQIDTIYTGSTTISVAHKKTAATKPTTTDTTTPTQASTNTCDLTKITGLVSGTTWDIQGGENFSTAVCGYLTREDVHNEMDDVTNNIASLVITSYKDAGFKTAIEAGISEGNTVNASSGGNNKFGLGCYDNSQITFNVPKNIGLGSSGTIDAVSTLKLINATIAKPVAVKLEFKEHMGSGCNCCNLAEIVEVQ